MSKNASPSYEHLFYINGTGISGVRDVSLGYSVTRPPINPLGIGHLQPTLGGFLQGEVSMTRDMIYIDPILELTGDIGVSGSIIYAPDLEEDDPLVIGFTSGYLTSYSVSVDVGNVPIIQSTFAVFGQLGSGVRTGELDFSGDNSLNMLEFVNQGSIVIDVDQSETNRVTRFAQDLTIERTPIYDLKEKTSQNYYAPSQVVTKTPIEMTTDFTVEVDDYKTANVIDNTRSGVYKRISSYIRTPNREEDGLQDEDEFFLQDENGEKLEGQDYTTVYEFAPISGNLLSEQIRSNTDGVLTVDLQFKNYLY